MTFDEAMEFGRSLPQSMWLDMNFKPMISRAEWEQLGRWRRWRDVLLGWQPLRDDPRDFPSYR